MSDTEDNNSKGLLSGGRLVGWLTALVALGMIVMTVTSEDRWSESAVRIHTFCLVDGLRAADDTGHSVEAAGMVADVIEGAVKARRGDPAELADAVSAVADSHGALEYSPMVRTLVAAVCTEIDRAYAVGGTEEQYLYRLSVLASCLKSAVNAQCN